MISFILFSSLFFFISGKLSMALSLNCQMAWRSQLHGNWVLIATRIAFYILCAVLCAADIYCCHRFSSYPHTSNQFCLQFLVNSSPKSASNVWILIFCCSISIIILNISYLRWVSAAIEERRAAQFICNAKVQMHELSEAAHLNNTIYGIRWRWRRWIRWRKTRFSCGRARTHALSAPKWFG